MNWRESVSKAEHYFALGLGNDLFLRDDDLPWEFVTSVEPGGSHRLEIDTSVWFRAPHPSGLVFRWSFDIEPREANGSGHYQIDTEGIRKVLCLLPEKPRADFRRYLAECACAVAKKAREWEEFATRQYRDAEMLYSTARDDS